MKVKINGVKGKLKVAKGIDETPTLIFWPKNKVVPWYLLEFKLTGEVIKYAGLPNVDEDRAQPFRLKGTQLAIKGYYDEDA